MSELTMKEIKTEEELKAVLELCHRILGTGNEELYGCEAWLGRLQEGGHPMVYAVKDDRIVSAVLGRSEGNGNVIIGMVACHEDYRRLGITRKLMAYFEERAKEMGFNRATLGSREDAFYESCGYKVIFHNGNQNVFQKKF